MLVSLDAWLALAHPLKNAVTPNLDRTETFSCLEAYKNTAVKPNIVLLGSSLMVAPVMQAEALLAQKPIVRFKQRESKYMEESLSKRLQAKSDVFCFAVAGAAVSDTFTIVRHIFANKENQPTAIVYGVAPRDFQDNTWPGIDSTEVFQVLADLNEAVELSTASDLSPERRMNIILGRVSSLWKYRSDLRMLITLRLKKLMERTMPWVVFAKYGSTLELKPQKHGQFPEEAKGELLVHPGLAMENVGETRTIQQYIHRYRPLNQINVEKQFAYFDNLLSLCKSRGISPVIVNMPLSQTNIELLPEGFYAQYKQKLALACNKYQATLIDMQKEPYGQSANYVDTVHLKPELSAGFLDDLTNELAKSNLASLLKKNEMTASTSSPAL